ncbi:MAG: putative sulfate/molybdate transporter [Armatimonadota bacterium]
MALSAKLSGTSILVMFGMMQILTGFIYRMPMSVPPLKAVAAIVIAQQVPARPCTGRDLPLELSCWFLQ